MFFRCITLVLLAFAVSCTTGTRSVIQSADCSDLDNPKATEIPSYLEVCLRRNIENFRKVYVYKLDSDSSVTLNAGYEICFQVDGSVYSVKELKAEGNEDLSHLLRTYLWYLKFPAGIGQSCVSQPFFFLAGP